MAMFAPFLFLLAMVAQDSTIAEDAKPDNLGWPRSVALEGRELVFCQPQLQSLHGNVATALTPVCLIENEQEFWCSMRHSGRIATDRGRRLVQVYEGRLEQVLFPPETESSTEQRTRTAADLAGIVEQWEPVFPMDSFVVALEFAESDPLGELDAPPDPLQIEFRTRPVCLVQVRGEPRLEQVYGLAVQQVVNTDAALLHDPKAGTFHLWKSGHWWNASALRGPYQMGSDKPGPLEKLTRERSDSPLPPGAEILVVQQPTAVIQSPADAPFLPIPDTSLAYLADTQTDVFRLEGATTRYYALLSGRWYVADLPPGPWEPVRAGTLPEDFAKIPPDSEKGYVLASVPGTREAQDALLDAHIPQTAVVQRGSLKLTVTYRGEPRFVPVEGTSLKYAPNTSFAVLQDGERYLCCYQAVWFEARAPAGPWSLCLEVPAEVSRIPSSSPLYHVRFARVYRVTGDDIEIGYTPGYQGSYVYQGTLVYGTGHDAGWDGFEGWGASGYSYRYDAYTGHWVTGDTRVSGDLFGSMSAMFAAGPGDGSREAGGAVAGNTASDLLGQVNAEQQKNASAEAGRVAKVRGMEAPALTPTVQNALRQRLAQQSAAASAAVPMAPQNMRFQKDAFALPDGKVFVVENNIWDGNHGPDAQYWGYRRGRWGGRW